MARENTIKVSDEELIALHEARDRLYFSESVPYGEVIQELADGPDVYLNNAQSGGPEIEISQNGGRYYVGFVYPRCGCDNQDMIYWEFGDDASSVNGCNSAELLSDMPKRDGIDLTKTKTERQFSDGPLLSNILRDAKSLHENETSGTYELPDGSTMTVEVTGRADGE